MANKKAPGTSSKVVTKAATKAATAAKSTSEAPVKKVSALREDERVEVETSARYGPISASVAGAYAAQISVADAEKRGKETKAAGVLREARAWVPIIHRVLSSGARVRYTESRFVYFLMSIDALARAVDGSGKRGAGTTLSLAEARVREARNVLLEILEAIVLGNDDAEAELRDARGISDRTDELLKSLRSLIELTETWLAKTDPISVALVESVRLTQADIDTARVAADALGASMKDKTVVGVERTNDTAEVNRLEGRVTFEMAVAMRAFSAAAKQGQGEKLVPGPATRHLLTPTAAPKKKKTA